MIILDMTKKSNSVRILTSAFKAENNILTLEIDLGEYDLTGKTITASFKDVLETMPLAVVNGLVQLPITNDLIKVGTNYIQLNFRWDEDKLEQSPIMTWNISQSITTGDVDSYTVDLITNLITELNATKMQTDTLVNSLDVIVTNGAESVENLQLLELDYANKAEALESTYAPQLTQVTADLAQKTPQTVTTNLQSQVNAIVLQGTSGDSSAEVAQTRVDSKGSVFLTMKRRTDNVESIVNNGEDRFSFLWEYGTIAGAGLFYDSTTRMRSKTYLNPSVDITIDLIVPIGYTLAVWQYTKSGETYTSIGANNKTNANKRLILQSIYHYRFVLFADDASTVTQSNCDAVVLSYRTVTNSKSFTLSKVATLQNGIVSKNLEIMLDWEYGVITGLGVLSNNDIALRTKGYIHFDNDLNVSVTVPSGYSVELWSYTYSGGNYTYKAVITNTINYTATLLTELYYKVCVKKIDNAFVDMTIANSVKIIGDKNAESINSLKNIEKSFVEKSLNLVLPQWEYGTIAGAGDLYASTTDMRSVDYLNYAIDTTVSVKVPTGFNLIAWANSYSNGVYSAVTTATITSTGYLLLASRYHYKFVLKPTGATNASLFLTKQVALAYLDTHKSNYVTVFKNKEDEMVDKIINAVTEDDIVFGLITDNHVGIANMDNLYKHPIILNKICERVGADFTINLGDTFTETNSVTTNKKRLNDYLQYNRDTWLPTMYCKGNHDVWQDTGDGLVGLSDSFINAVTNRNNRHIIKSANKLYYYFDVRNVRFIVLDSSSNTGNGFSNEQITFLTDSFTTLPDGMKVIVYTHIPLDASLMLQATPINANSIRTILENNTSKVIAVMHGHVHWDNNADLNGITYIATCNAVPTKQNTSSYTGLGTPTSYDRVYGAYTEYCFDIIMANSITGVIRTFRFGAGNDRTLTKT